MSEVKVNKISPRTNCGTVQLGDSGDTFTIPSGATITNNGTQTGFGRTGTVDWQTGSIKTATFTAANGEGYFVDTSGGAVTMNLPSSPSAGNIVAVKDYLGTFADNNLTIGRGGSPINGGAGADVAISTSGASIVLVYVDGTQGWVATQDDSSTFSGATYITATGGTITTCGNDKIHTFTGPGTFTVCSASSAAANNIVSYLVLAGGGGGASWGGGGGGAGGYREIKNPINGFTASPLDGYGTPGNRITVTATGFPITVGGGGSAASLAPFNTATPAESGNGVNSTFSTITSTGGGGGGNRSVPTPQGGASGGSGGGGADAGMGTGAPAAGAAAPATAGALAEAAAACAGAAPASAGTSRPMARLASRDRLSRCSGISVNVAPTAYFGEILLSETAQTDCKINYC